MPESQSSETDRLDKSLPYPDSDIPPTLQRTIRHKIESGDDEGVPAEDFVTALQRASRSERSEKET